MKKLPRYIIVLAVVTASGALLFGFLLPALARTSNCGGNSAARFACNNSYWTVRFLSADGEQPDTRQLLKENFAEISRSTQNHWIPGANILMRTNFFVDLQSKQILAVCDTSYGNVPQPTIWNGYKTTPAHAVSYSDGTSGFITPAQFKELNLSQFIDVSQWQTNGLSDTNRIKSL